MNGYGGPRCAYTPATDPTGARRGVDTCKFWNPFAVSALVQPGDPAYNDPTVSNWLVGNRTTHDSGELKTYNAVTTGKLWEMSGGTTGLAIGVERREVSFSQQWDEGSKQIGFWGFNGAFAQSDFSGSSATNAAFAEMVLYPFKSLEIQLAGRHEKTSYEGRGVSASSIRSSVCSGRRSKACSFAVLPVPRFRPRGLPQCLRNPLGARQRSRLVATPSMHEAC